MIAMIKNRYWTQDFGINIPRNANIVGESGYYFGFITADNAKLKLQWFAFSELLQWNGSGWGAVEPWR